MMDDNNAQIDSTRLRLVGRTLKSIRNSMGLTQAEFAAKLGISRKTCSNYELGKRDPGTLFWLRLSDLTGDDYLQTPVLYESKRPATVAAARSRGYLRLLSTLLEKRKQLIISKKAFASETMSPFQQQVYAVAQVVLGGAMMAATLRISAVRYEFQFGEPIAGVDWSFPISFVLILLLLPCQIWRLVEWRTWANSCASAH